jgi:hypothetical protein
VGVQYSIRSSRQHISPGRPCCFVREALHARGVCSHGGCTAPRGPSLPASLPPSSPSHACHLAPDEVLQRVHYVSVHLPRPVPRWLSVATIVLLQRHATIGILTCNSLNVPMQLPLARAAVTASLLLSLASYGLAIVYGVSANASSASLCRAGSVVTGLSGITSRQGILRLALQCSDGSVLSPAVQDIHGFWDPLQNASTFFNIISSGVHGFDAARAGITELGVVSLSLRMHGVNMGSSSTLGAWSAPPIASDPHPTLAAIQVQECGRDAGGSQLLVAGAVVTYNGGQLVQHLAFVCAAVNTTGMISSATTSRTPAAATSGDWAQPVGGLALQLPPSMAAGGCMAERAA